MYGRLSDGDLIYAPKCIEIGGWKIWNGTAEQYASLGYKPVRYASPEEAPEGYEYTFSWSETAEEIVQTYELVQVGLTAEEALSIIIGEV
ncbi:MAG: hypothetical protein IJM76_06010 [Lachnospiraceae bacterium]|nr:hypothetical protein [Lachnospiraceae bacterium]